MNTYFRAEDGKEPLAYYWSQSKDKESLTSRMKRRAREHYHTRRVTFWMVIGMFF